MSQPVPLIFLPPSDSGSGSASSSTGTKPFVLARKRALMACLGCRKRRVRCNAINGYDHPCDRCSHRNLPCEYISVAEESGRAASSPSSRSRHSRGSSSSSCSPSPSSSPSPEFTSPPTRQSKSSSSSNSSAAGHGHGPTLDLHGAAPIPGYEYEYDYSCSQPQAAWNVPLDYNYHPNSASAPSHGQPYLTPTDPTYIQFLNNSYTLRMAVETHTHSQTEVYLPLSGRCTTCARQIESCACGFGREYFY